LLDLRLEPGNFLGLLRVRSRQELVLLLPLRDLALELLLMALLSFPVCSLRRAVLFSSPLSSLLVQSRAAGLASGFELTSILSGIELLTWATTLPVVGDVRRSGVDLYDRSEPEDDMLSKELSSVA
jgi:hypothetical protein